MCSEYGPPGPPSSWVFRTVSPLTSTAAEPKLTKSMRLLTCSSFTTGFTCLAGLFKVSSRIANNSLLLHGEGLLEETTALRGQ